MSRDIAHAFTSQRDAGAAANELLRQFGELEARAVFFFCSPSHDGAALSAALHRRYPRAEVIGCTTAGELTSATYGVDSVSALALSEAKVRRCAGALARFEGGVEEGTRQAMARIGRALELDLRGADPQKYVGVVLLEGLKMREEDTNVALGNIAPLLSFVGGSAGDNLEFKETRVFYNGETSSDGAALGSPWIRSPQRLMPDGGLRFYCKVHDGMEMHLMRATDLMQDTRQAIERARAQLGGLAGGLLFNCILRRLELDDKGQHAAFLRAFEGLQAAGFHTYGESWLGHINQTLTALLIV